MTNTDPQPYTTETQPPLAGPSDRPDRADTGASLVDRRLLHFSRRTIVWIVLFLAVVGGWVGFAEIEETVAADGAIVPAGQIRPVQHLDGGVILSVAAKEGQLVSPGDILMRLDSEQLAGRLKQARNEEAALRLKAERLRAIGDGREPDFSFVDPEFKELVKDQWAIYNGYLRSRENARLILESRIEQRETDLRRIDSEDETLTRKAQILAEEMAMREALFQKGLNPKVVFLNVKRQVAGVRGAIAELITRREKISKTIEEARIELQALDSDGRSEALGELGNVTRLLAQAEEQRKRFAARVAALDVRAPVRGFIQGIDGYQKGQVVAAGATLMKVIPVDEELVADVRVAPRDISRLSTGQAVAVRVVGVNGARQIGGEVRGISSGTVSGGQGAPYYRVTVALDQAFAGTDATVNRFIPGMEVKVSVRTGRRHLWHYLVRPQSPPKTLF